MPGRLLWRIPLMIGLVCLCIPRLCAADSTDPPEVQIGERLFLETRFAQFFFTNCHGNVNATLPSGDPVMDVTVTAQGTFPGPFAGKSMNCRACHLVDEQGLTPGGGNRTYDDFARRSPVPAREDGKTSTPRNAPPLVDSALPRKGATFFHLDGQFVTLQDLIKTTYTGRNFGWLPNEQKTAIHHIAQVIREDDGTGDLAQEYGGSYKTVLSGVSKDFRLPARYQLNVDNASDEQILDGIAKLVAAYVESLVFSQDDNGDFNGSPYDVFLQKNNLPRHPDKGETNIDYARRLRGLVSALSSPQFVTSADGTFAFHNQAFAFGTQELDGLKIFLNEPPPGTPPPGGVGNCIACHAPPTFTDFLFHNNGASQEEYDQIHGKGAFAQLVIPDAATRRANFNAWLPPTPRHPDALGPYIGIPSADHPEYADLGLWNEFDNPDVPRPQAKLYKFLKTLCPEKHCRRDDLLPVTVALFKTPGLRDLADSGPYLHNGSKDTLAQVMGFYSAEPILARAGQLRNVDPQMQGISLTAADAAALVSFLESLNEDYH